MQSDLCDCVSRVRKANSTRAHASNFPHHTRPRACAFWYISLSLHSWHTCTCTWPCTYASAPPSSADATARRGSSGGNGTISKCIERHTHSSRARSRICSNKVTSHTHNGTGRDDYNACVCAECVCALRRRVRRRDLVSYIIS